MMNKITPDHLCRDAYVYVRQSTHDQVVNNPESRRRQYALRQRAETLGWRTVVIVDDDLGKSGSGVARQGFERLLLAVGSGNAGAVLAIEASRLARNGRDWHTLLEVCGLVGCLLIDEAGVYDPRQMDDRMLLGMKGTFSELELSMLRQRSQEALRLKAQRGDLHTSVAVGYVRSSGDKLEMDPDDVSEARWTWCSASSASSAVPARSPFGRGRNASCCPWSAMDCRGGSLSGGCLGTTPCTGS